MVAEAAPVAAAVAAKAGGERFFLEPAKQDSKLAVLKYPGRVPHEVDEQLVEMERLGLAYATDILKHDPEGFCVTVRWAPPHVIFHQHRTLQDGSPASAAARDEVILGDAIVGINGVWVGDSPQLWSSLAAEEEDPERDEEHFDWVMGHLAAVPAGTECRFHLVRRHKKDDLKSLIARRQEGLSTIADHCDVRQRPSGDWVVHATISHPQGRKWMCVGPFDDDFAAETARVHLCCTAGFRTESPRVELFRFICQSRAALQPPADHAVHRLAEGAAAGLGRARWNQQRAAASRRTLTGSTRR